MLTLKENIKKKRPKNEPEGTSSKGFYLNWTPMVCKRNFK